MVLTAERFRKYFRNVHLMHVIRNVDDKKITGTWTGYEGNVETLDSIIKGYLWHLKLHINEIKELMNM